ncbi:unnamed protein product [Porites evermanni]|uniref:Uncharacterized protein n=1 Tax=Porites evermanni TaxID=104178 RepID=A0ABN8MB95_9CNID|nr:unnamed protein product [Porites evermanni]
METIAFPHGFVHVGCNEFRSCCTSLIYGDNRCISIKDNIVRFLPTPVNIVRVVKSGHDRERHYAVDQAVITTACLYDARVLNENWDICKKDIQTGSSVLGNLCRTCDKTGEIVNIANI